MGLFGKRILRRSSHFRRGQRSISSFGEKVVARVDLDSHECDWQKPPEVWPIAKDETRREGREGSANGSVR